MQRKLLPFGQTLFKVIFSVQVIFQTIGFMRFDKIINKLYLALCVCEPRLHFALSVRRSFSFISFKYVAFSVYANIKKFAFRIKQTRFANNVTFKRQSGLLNSRTANYTCCFSQFLFRVSERWRLRTLPPMSPWCMKPLASSMIRI